MDRLEELARKLSFDCGFVDHCLEAAMTGSTLTTDFERIFAIELPGHGLAAPVEEAAVGLDCEFIDDG